MRVLFLTACLIALVPLFNILTPMIQANETASNMTLFPADDPNIQYMGRIDFSDPKAPKFWAPGVTIKAKFEGPTCDLLINDQVLWGNSHNWIEVVIDGSAPVRMQTTGAVNDIPVATGLADGTHTITVCKDTESGIGWLQFIGFRCRDLLPMPRAPLRKIEFIGDSITVGDKSDQSAEPCGEGQWYDQQNNYMSYGPTTARTLGARWQITAVSGIGLVHSCCGMTFAMPDVFDKLNDRPDGSQWDFSRYQPDVATICLGQNDGEMDPGQFDSAYVSFIKQVRSAYPHAQIVCLTSPMADSNLCAYQKENLTKIVADVNAAGDSKVHCFFFSRQYDGGCGGHPDVRSHQLIAAELSGYLKPLMHWRT